MFVFQSVLAWVDSIDDNSVRSIPPAVRDDIIAAILVLPLSSSNIRWEIETTVSATNATPTAGGGASTETIPQVARVLYHLCERRGERVRLDWNAMEENELFTDMRQCQPDIQDPVPSHGP